MTYTIRSVPLDGKCPTSYMMVIAMFALYLTVYEIFANYEKCQNFDLKNEGQVMEYKNGTCAIRLEMFDFI